MSWSFSAVLAATWAARTESLSLGRTTTSCAPDRTMASSSIPVEGRSPGPPWTTTAPASSNSPASPGPAATATMARPTRFCGSRAAICSAKCVTRTRCGRPASMPASMAEPTSSTWTCTFQSPSPPTTTRESPSPARVPRSFAMVSSGASRRYITSYAGPSSTRSAPGSATMGRGIRRPASTGGGRLPVRAVSAASRITTTPRPPASTTPASRRTCSWSGVRASASRAAAALVVSTSRDRTVGSLSSSLAAASEAARQTDSMVPSTGVPTAA